MTSQPAQTYSAGRFDLFLQSMTGSETSFLAGCPFLTLYTQSRRRGRT